MRDSYHDTVQNKDDKMRVHDRRARIGSTEEVHVAQKPPTRTYGDTKTLEGQSLAATGSRVNVSTFDLYPLFFRYLCRLHHHGVSSRHDLVVYGIETTDRDLS
jgi:hypothetical protein